MRRPSLLSATYSCQRGLSLVELMVGVAVGLIIMAAVTLLFVNSSRARQENEKTSQQIENGRYATQLLMDEARLAGYYGEYDPGSLSLPSTLPAPNDVTVGALAYPVQGYDNVSGASALPAALQTALSDVKAGTDVLLVRRASTCLAGQGGCAASSNASNYFQTTLCRNELNGATQVVIGPGPYSAGSFPLTQKDCSTPAGLRTYYVRAYFVANNDQAGDGIPTLKMAELGSGGFNIVPLVEGIEQMQLQYGVTNSSAAGTPACYLDDPATIVAAANCPNTMTSAVTNWHYVAAFKVQLLARNTQGTAGYTDTKTYSLGNAPANTPGNPNFTPGGFYRRHVYSTVVRLNNVAGRFGQ